MIAVTSCTTTQERARDVKDRRDVCRSRDVEIGLHIMIADGNLFSRPLIIIVIHNVNLQGATWSLLQGRYA